MTYKNPCLRSGRDCGRSPGPTVDQPIPSTGVRTGLRAFGDQPGVDHDSLVLPYCASTLFLSYQKNHAVSSTRTVFTSSCLLTTGGEIDISQKKISAQGGGYLAYMSPVVGGVAVAAAQTVCMQSVSNSYIPPLSRALD